MNFNGDIESLYTIEVIDIFSVHTQLHFANIENNCAKHGIIPDCIGVIKIDKTDNNELLNFLQFAKPIFALFR